MDDRSQLLSNAEQMSVRMKCCLRSLALKCCRAQLAVSCARSESHILQILGVQQKLACKRIPSNQVQGAFLPFTEMQLPVYHV